MVERTDENTLKTFNPAKKYAEEILFPMMESYQRFMRQSDFGTDALNDAKLYSEEIREIERFNGLKASNDVLFNLINTIKSTVLLKGNKEEISQVEDITDNLGRIKEIFYDHKERFFISTNKGGKNIEIINRNYFEKIKKIILICYVNIEILMTKNKLLFSDAKDEFASDAEIQDEIMREYAGE